ncbi:MAG: DUF5723 family protein [Chitinophagales bacterium]
MERKIFCLIFLFSIIHFAQATPDSTKTRSSAEYIYMPSTSIFGIFDPVNVDMENNNFVFMAHSSFYTASNCFTVDFIKNFFGSGFITEEMKNNASENLTDLNTIGIDFYNGVWMMKKSKNDGDNIFLAGIEYNFEESSQFTDDLFHVAFYGNYDMQGETADFSKSKFSLTSVMEYKVGMLKIFDDNYNGFKLGATAGLVQGLSGVDVKAPVGTMFTAEDGRYLDFDYDFSIYTSGENKPSLTSFTGAGFCFDIFGQAYFQGPEITINAMINDIGVVFWNNDPLKISGDSTQRFEGIEIDNLFSSSTETTNGSSDSLLEILGVVREDNAFSQALPARLNASATKSFSDKTFYLTFGTQYIFNTPYKPLFFVQTGKTLTPLQLTLSVNAHIGGYGGFNAGIDITKNISDFLQLKIGSNSLLGVISPASFTGSAAYGSLAVRF